MFVSECNKSTSIQENNKVPMFGRSVVCLRSGPLIHPSVRPSTFVLFACFISALTCVCVCVQRFYLLTLLLLLLLLQFKINGASHLWNILFALKLLLL